jgi:hypothetical protein
MKYLFVFGVLLIGFALTWFICRYDDSDTCKTYEEKGGDEKNK